MYGVFVVVTRTPSSTFERIPQQSWYEQRWTNATDQPGDEPGKAGRLLRSVERSRLLTAAARGLITGWRSLAPVRQRFRRKGIGRRPDARY
jgi:hypothetical protein